MDEAKALSASDCLRGFELSSQTSSSGAPEATAPDLAAKRVTSEGGGAGWADAEAPDDARTDRAAEENGAGATNDAAGAKPESAAPRSMAEGESAASTLLETPIFTRDFVLTCLASLCGYASFYILLGAVPLYVKHVGGSELEVGLVVGVFSAVSLCVRMPLGRACDEKGKRPFMLMGAIVLALCGLVYSWAGSVGALIASRALHGLGWALFGTAVYALVAETIPASRRGEAMGYYGISSNIAMALGPAIGFAILQGGRFGAVFAFSSAMAVLAFVLTTTIREGSARDVGEGEGKAAGADNAALQVATAAEKNHTATRQQCCERRARGEVAGKEGLCQTCHAFEADRRLHADHRHRAHADPHAGPRHHPMFERSALLPSAVMGVLTVSYSAIVSFLPLYAKVNGVENPGFFFTVYALALVTSRTFTGRLSDRYGRAAVILPGIGLIAVALMLAAPLAVNVVGVGVIGALFGLGFATVQSSLMAMIADRAAPGHRGAAMGTYMTALDLGIGAGAMLCGLLSDSLGFAPMFAISGASALAAMAVFVVLDVWPRSRQMKKGAPENLARDESLGCSGK